MAELLRKQQEALRTAGENASGYFTPMLHGERGAAEMLRRLGLFEKVSGPGDLDLEYRLTDAGRAHLAALSQPSNEGDNHDAG